MKTYKEYYAMAKAEEEDWLEKPAQKNKWWKAKTFCTKIGLKGEYFDTVKFITDDEKTDVSLFTNYTNVKNSEWACLFSMLGQALIDWCLENVSWFSLWSFSLNIERVLDGKDSVYSCSYKVNNRLQGNIVLNIDENTLAKFDECKNVLCDIFDEFIRLHGYDIPLDWNHFHFSLDDLYTSCSCGQWVSASDGCMGFGNYKEDEGTDYDEFILCM